MSSKIVTFRISKNGVAVARDGEEERAFVHRIKPQFSKTDPSLAVRCAGWTSVSNTLCPALKTHANCSYRNKQHFKTIKNNLSISTCSEFKKVTWRSKKYQKFNILQLSKLFFPKTRCPVSHRASGHIVS